MLPTWFAWGIICFVAILLFGRVGLDHLSHPQKKKTTSTPAPTPPPKTAKKRIKKPATPPEPVVSPNLKKTSEIYQVLAWHDGDTVEVRHGENAPLRLRIEGIDAPESKQEFGAESLAFAHKHAMGNVRVQFHTNSQTYGRAVAQVLFQDSDKQWHDYGLSLIAAGLAWAEPQYLRKRDPRYIAYQSAHKAAQKAKKGLWKDPNALRPQAWREAQKSQ